MVNSKLDNISNNVKDDVSNDIRYIQYENVVANTNVITNVGWCGDKSNVVIVMPIIGVTPKVSRHVMFLQRFYDQFQYIAPWKSNYVPNHWLLITLPCSFNQTTKMANSHFFFIHSIVHTTRNVLESFIHPTQFATISNLDCPTNLDTFILPSMLLHSLS